MPPGLAVMAARRTAPYDCPVLARKISRTLDLRGQVCPGPTVDTRLTLKELAAGEVLEVVLDYYPARQTIPDLMGELRFPCELEESAERGPHGESVFRFFITKT
jgi:TusA-related sulfurtransferase